MKIGQRFHWARRFADWLTGFDPSRIEVYLDGRVEIVDVCGSIGLMLYCRRRNSPLNESHLFVLIGPGQCTDPRKFKKVLERVTGSNSASFQWEDGESAKIEDLL